MYPPFLQGDLDDIGAFLRGRGLEAPAGEPDFAVSVHRAGLMVGTGSLRGRVIQGLAVDESLQGEGLSARLVSELEAEAARRGMARLFVFTSPRSQAIFEALGYHRIAEAKGSAVLLEKGGGLAAWLEELKAAIQARGPAGPGAALPVSALVMNCNPFTLGHRHLAATAAAASSLVVILVVREEASSFPFEARLDLVRAGIADLPNVLVLPGSDYIVSRATFPTYFLKDQAGDAAAIHARLDADLFARQVAPALGATRRYVATEPYSPVTATYNAALAAVLPPLGVELVEIPRLEVGGEAVSASAVRRAIREGRLEDARPLVPASTWAWLSSPGAAPVLARVAASEGRH